jgi:antitoxin component YwqK of YwqJK toxin-antitoxin module
MRGVSLKISLSLILSLVFVVQCTKAYSQIGDTTFSFSGKVLGIKDTLNQTYTEFEYYKNGKIQTRQTLDKSGNFTNEDIVWFDNGDTALFVQFDSTGLLSGLFFSKYRNGNLKTQGTFLRGALINKFCEYYENGDFKIQGNYSDQVKQYYPLDSTVSLPQEMRSDIEFECYLLIDESLISWGMPDIIKTYTCITPVMNGAWLEYSEKGKVTKSERYKDGVLVE